MIPSDQGYDEEQDRIRAEEKTAVKPTKRDATLRELAQYAVQMQTEHDKLQKQVLDMQRQITEHRAEELLSFEQVSSMMKKAQLKRLVIGDRLIIAFDDSRGDWLLYAAVEWVEVLS